MILKRPSEPTEKDGVKGLDSRPLLLTALTIAVVLLTIVLSLAFAQSQQAQRLADAADDRQAAADAIAIAAFTRNQMESALLFVVAAQSGVADPEQQDTAIAALRDTARVYAETDNEALAVEKSAIVTGLATLVGLLEDGNAAGARAAIDTQLAPRLDTVRAAAEAERFAADEIIAVESSSAGRWGLITSFGVAIIVPSVALIAFRGIVARRRKQQELEQRLEREYELNAAKDEMISNLSHELRTPLTGIYGFALAMEEAGFADRELQAEMTNLIIREAADLSRMVDDLLTAAKAEGDGLQFQIEHVDVAREVHEAATPFLRGGQDILLDIEPAIVAADRLRLRQILRNLISNATHHGGPEVAVRGRRDENHYRFEVADNGTGVPDHVAERLFERFVHQGETPVLTGSIGLGLSIVKVLAAGMGGHVTHEQNEDETVFTVTLPTVEGVGTDLADLVEPAKEPRRVGPGWSRGPEPATGYRSHTTVPAPPTPLATRR